MAKGKSTRSANTADIAKTLLRSPTYTLTPIIRTTLPTPPPELVLAQLDRRAFRPDASVRPPGAIQRKDARLKLTNTNHITFDQPNRIAICARRKQRKEVLHALKKTGRNSGHGRKTRNFWSSIKC